MTFNMCSRNTIYCVLECTDKWQFINLDLDRACRNSTRGNGFKLSKYRLDIENTTFTVRAVKHWNRLPTEVVDALSPEMFKVRIDKTLNKVT